MPLPCTLSSGFGMNVACTPWLAATSFTTNRNVMMLSAIVSASVWRRSISCWLGASSWKLYSTGMLIVSSVRIVCLRKRAGHVGGGQIEEPALVERHRRLALLRRREVEELDVGSDEEREAHARARPAGCAAAPAADRPRTACCRGCGCRRTPAPRWPFAIAPRQHLEGVGVGHGQHVALERSPEPVDRGAIERHPVLERVLQLGRADREALQAAEHVGEPQPDQPHPAFLDGVQDVVTLLFQHHGSFYSANLCR